MADELADALYEKGIVIREEMFGPEHGGGWVPQRLGGAGRDGA
jgi:hypothetical protein